MLSAEVQEILKVCDGGGGRSLGHKSASSEHVLLALLRDEGSPAAKLLRDSGVDLKQMRDKLKRKLRSGRSKSHQPLRLKALMRHEATKKYQDTSK